MGPVSGAGPRRVGQLLTRLCVKAGTGRRENAGCSMALMLAEVRRCRAGVKVERPERSEDERP